MEEGILKRPYLIRVLVLVGVIIGLGFVAIPVQAEMLGKMQKLQQVIAAQQKQLDALQKQLESQGQLLQQLLADKSAPATDVKIDVKATAQPPAEKYVTPGHWRTWAPIADVHPDEKVVTSGEERVKLSISGMVNRAVNVVDDGKDTDAYFVDNDNAESRFTFLAKAKINEDLTFGSKLELTIAPDKASDVNQNNKEAGDVFEQRWAAVAIESKRFGKMSLGKGFTASYGIASRDLSKTSVISYVTVADTAGGMLFRQKGDDTLTNLQVNQAFQSYDGLNRRSRVRYDTPTYSGFQLSTSLLTAQKYDVALWWGGQGYGFKAISAAGVADPKLDDTDLQYAGSFSLLHDETGLNLTLSTGLLERDKQADGENYYAKLGWIADLFSVGETAFAIDYNQTENQPTEDDDGYSTGVAAVQFFEKYGTEIYFLYRKYSLDRDVEPEVHDIDVVSIGTRVKF
jgi:predicted porin